MGNEVTGAVQTPDWLKVKCLVFASTAFLRSARVPQATYPESNFYYVMAVEKSVATTKFIRSANIVKPIGFNLKKSLK